MASPAKKRKNKVVEADADVATAAALAVASASADTAISDTKTSSPQKAAQVPAAQVPAAKGGFNSAALSGSGVPSAAKQLKSSDVKASKPTESLASEKVFNTDMLRIYYDRLYPVKLMFDWLRYGDALSAGGESEMFRRREWSFTLRDDIYIRFQSFATENDFRRALMDKLPFKIDIGACYNASPAMKDSLSRFAPESKEVVFDVDITDYDSIRMCGCKEAAVCTKCWTLMTAAIVTTHAALTEDFGFKNILWVFSGRRGVHCWVCDPRARALSDEARCALIEYLSLYMGNDKNKTMNVPSPLPHSLQRAYELLEPMFVESYIKTLGLLDTNEGRKTILKFFGDDEKVHERVEWPASCKSGEERWSRLVSNVEAVARKDVKAGPKLRNALHRIVFSYQYPRLDINVSKHMNHLLKAPWCVHPKTGKVCVPINPLQPELFDPNTVPTLWQLHDELNTPEAKKSTPAALWRCTGLKEHILFFVTAFFKPLIDSLKNAADSGATAGGAASLDF